MNRRILMALAVLVAIAGIVAVYFVTRPEDPFRVSRNGREARYFEVGALPVT